MFVATSYIPTFIQFRKHAVLFLKNLNQILSDTKKQGAKIPTAYLPHNTHTNITPLQEPYPLQKK